MATLPRLPALLLAGVLAGVLALSIGRHDRPPERMPRGTGRQTLTAGSIADAVRRAAPAVVAVSATPPAGSSARWRRSGSGFVARSDGLVLTSADLVAGAGRIEVRRAGARAVAAHVVAFDRGRGVALLRIAARRPLPVLPIGAEAGMPAGSFVVSLGRSGATLGIVSAAPRSLRLSGGGLRRLLQTDAPLPGGNLGGPLLDLGGRAVGMALPQLGGRGIGFAVPAGELRQVVARAAAAMDRH